MRFLSLDGSREYVVDILCDILLALGVLYHHPELVYAGDPGSDLVVYDIPCLLAGKQLLVD